MAAIASGKCPSCGKDRPDPSISCTHCGAAPLGPAEPGRAKLSRHMYGDAADIFIDNDGNGNMDDLNGDGKVNIGDSRMICEAVEAVERNHPELIGGCGVYPGTSSHGPFAHIDTRGYRARWTGSGDGG